MEEIVNNIAELWSLGLLGELLFLVILPLGLLAIGIKLYIEYQAHQANKSLEEAKTDHSKLEEERLKFKKDAEEAKAKADALREKRESRTTEDVDEDWHLKE